MRQFEKGSIVPVPSDPPSDPLQKLSEHSEQHPKPTAGDESPQTSEHSEQNTLSQRHLELPESLDERSGLEN